MFRKEIPKPQMLAWLFVAMTAPMAQNLGGSGWVFVACAGAVCAVLTWGVVGLTTDGDWKPWFCAAQLLWLAVAAGICAGSAADSWPMGDAWPVVPLTMLALAGWSAQNGPLSVSRVAGVLFFLILIGYGPILGAGAGQVEWENLAPYWGRPDRTAGFWLLMPAVAAFLPWQKQGMGKPLAGAVIFGAVAAGITSGVLTQGLTQTLEQPFYEMSRSLRLLGVAERLEALVCALLTVGWFALLSLLLSAGGCLFGKICNGKERLGVWLLTLAAAAVMLCKLHITGVLAVAGAVVFWVFLPVLTQGMGKRKKSKNVKKRY